MGTTVDTNTERMRALAVEMLKTAPEAMAWFRYGATYVVSLLAAIDFYRAAGRLDEVADLLADLRKTAAADAPATVARNFMRLGIYWDEATCVEATKRAGLNTEELLTLIRGNK